MSAYKDLLHRAGLVPASELSREVADELDDSALDIGSGYYMGWPLADDQSYRHPAHEAVDRRRAKAYGAPRSFYVQGSLVMRSQEVGWVPWVGARPVFESSEPKAWAQDLAQEGVQNFRPGDLKQQR